MLNKFITVELVLSESKLVNGRTIKTNHTLKGYAKEEKIYQSRIDNKTEYTMKLTYRLRCKFNTKLNHLIEDKLINTDYIKLKGKNYQVLNITPLNYNEYIIELGGLK